MRFLLLVFFPIAFASAQAQETPSPPPAPRTVHLHFAPPPLEGTISLGIYDAQGKLVRILHREDGVSDFTAGHDALETAWDGNDDAGHPLPAGRYSAHGYLVGEVKVEGVDYFFNDWVTDANSPHLAHITRLASEPGKLKLSAKTPAQKAVTALYDFASEKLTAAESTPASSPSPSEVARLPNPLGSDASTNSAPGKDGTLWRIRRLPDGGAEVEQLPATVDPAKASGILRKLTIPPNEPQPVGIAASATEERIFLLEQTPALERVRSLTLVATQPDGTEQAQAISDWKVDFEKKIVDHQNFGLVDGQPALAPNPSPAPTSLSQALRENPLQQDQPGQVELAVGFDADGSYLKTVDGLPLRTISDTPNLSRILLARPSESALDVFQDDGAVVEQFRLSGLAQMMAFDCGDFELK